MYSGFTSRILTNSQARHLPALLTEELSQQLQLQGLANTSYDAASGALLLFGYVASF